MNLLSYLWLTLGLLCLLMSVSKFERTPVREDFFVHFTFTANDGTTGDGMLSMYVLDPSHDYKQIEEMAEHIRKNNNFKTVVITNFLTP